MQNNINKVGEIIRSSRLRNNLTVEVLAERIGISNRYLSAIENEGRIPSYYILGKLINTLSIDANQFFYDVISDNPEITFISRKLENCSTHEINVVIATLNALRNKQFQ